MEGPDALQSRLRFSEGKLEEEQHLNTQLQQDYDELSKKLAAAELTIDRLRLGVNTRVHKTLVYELKEQERERAPSHGGVEDDDAAAAVGRHPRGENGGAADDGFGSSPPPDAEEPSELQANSFSAHSRGPSVSSISQSLFSPGRPGSLDSQHLALILLCQSLQDDIDALLHRLEQTPAHERLRDAPAVRTEFAGLQRRFGELEEGLEHLRQARRHQPLAVNPSQPLENEMAVLREMMQALEATLHPERFSLPRTQLSSTRSDEAASLPVDRVVSPISIDSLAGVPSIGADCDLSQYGRSISPEGSPVPSPMADTPQPRDHDHDRDVIHSSSLSSSSSLPQSAAPKPASTVSRRRVWQSSSDSENASPSSRKPPSLPLRSDNSLVSLHSPALRAASPAVDLLTLVPATHPYTNPYALITPASHGGSSGNSSSATHTYLPTTVSAQQPQQQPPPPPAATLPNAPRRAPWLGGHAPLPLQPVAHYPPGHRNGTAVTADDDADAVPRVPERTSSALHRPPGAVVEPDSGYTGSERQAVTVRRNPVACAPVRSSTGSELLPIASNSSSSSCSDADRRPMSPSVSGLGHHAAPDAAAFKPIAPEHPSVASMPPPRLSHSTSAGNGVGVPASPSTNSAILSLRADLARLRQQLLDDSPLQGTPPPPPSQRTPCRPANAITVATATTPPPGTPTTTTTRVRLPSVLCRSPQASEAALRNLLDTMTTHPTSATSSPTLSSSGGGDGGFRCASPHLVCNGRRASPSASSLSHSSSGRSGTMTTGSASAPSPVAPRHQHHQQQQQQQPRVHSQSTLSNGFTSSSASSASSSASNGVRLPSAAAPAAPPSQVRDAGVLPTRSLSSSFAHPQAPPRRRVVASTQTPLRDLPARRRYGEVSPAHGERRWQRDSARPAPYLVPGRDAAVQTQHQQQQQHEHRYHAPPAAGVDAYSQSGTPLLVTDAYSQTAAEQQYGLPDVAAFSVADAQAQTGHDSHPHAQHTPREKSVLWRSGDAPSPELPGYGGGLRHDDDDGGDDDVRHVYRNVSVAPAQRRYVSSTPTQTDAAATAAHHHTYSLPAHHYHHQPRAYLTSHPVHVQAEPSPLPPPPPMMSPMMSSYGTPQQQRSHRTAVPMSSTPVQYVYADDAAHVQYLDELNLTEANRQAAQLRRRSEGMVRSLEDSLSYHSFVA